MLYMAMGMGCTCVEGKGAWLGETSIRAAWGHFEEECVHKPRSETITIPLALPPSFQLLYPEKKQYDKPWRQPPPRQPHRLRI